MASRLRPTTDVTKKMSGKKKFKRTKGEDDSQNLLATSSPQSRRRQSDRTSPPATDLAHHRRRLRQRRTVTALVDWGESQKSVDGERSPALVFQFLDFRDFLKIFVAEMCTKLKLIYFMILCWHNFRWGWGFRWAYDVLLCINPFSNVQFLDRNDLVD